MRPPKQPRRSIPKEPQQREPLPSTEPVREPAPREEPAAPESARKRKTDPKYKAARNQEPERQPASDQLGVSVRASVAKLRRERTKKQHEKTPVPEHRKRSSEPYPLSEKIKLRRRAQRKRLLVRFGLALAAIALVAGGVWLLFFSAVFAVKGENIRLRIDDPAGIVDEGQVRAMVLEAEGTPVLRLPSGEIEDSLEALPEVKLAQVAGSLPSGVDVAIVAREPVACVGAPDSCVGISVDAVQLEIPQELRDQLPKLTMDLESDRAAEQLRGILDAVAALPGDVREHVQSASVNPSGLIEFKTDTATIKWGASEENDKKARIIAVLLDQPASTYDVTVPNAPVTY